MKTTHRTYVTKAGTVYVPHNWYIVCIDFFASKVLNEAICNSSG